MAPRILKNLIARAIRDPDNLAVLVRYRSADGELTDRAVSPIRFVGQEKFLALCLCREEPRLFHLSRCQRVRIVPAYDLLMPVEIVRIQEVSRGH